MQKLKCFQFYKNLRKQFQVHHQKQRRLATKSPRYKSSEKIDNTKFKGVQLQNKVTPLVIWDLHHEGVGLVSNLRITPDAIFVHLCGLRLLIIQAQLVKF
jgi:hypothetical protein